MTNIKNPARLNIDIVL